MSNKKYQEVEEHESVASNEQKNNETEAPLSKSAKKRAKKNQKKAAEATNVQTSLVNQNEKTTKTPEKSGDEKTTPEKIDKNETIMKHAEKKPEKKKSISQKTEKKKMEKIDEEKVDDQGGTSTVVEKEDEQPGKVEKRPVPRIQRFDANGKPIKTLAGKNSFYLGQITPHNVFVSLRSNSFFLFVFPLIEEFRVFSNSRRWTRQFFQSSTMTSFTLR